MRWSEIALLVVAVVALLVWRSYITASRLDRLHRKVSASRIALDAQLVRRASAAADLAASSLLDPASAVILADASYAVIDGEGPVTLPEQALSMSGLGEAREALESGLSGTLREVLDEWTVQGLRADPAGASVMTALAETWYRAQLARRFHNEAVGQAHRARRHWYVRWLHLAGHAPWPTTVELDDQMPDGLVARTYPRDLLE
jgi:hypothetical protein